MKTSLALIAAALLAIPTVATSQLAVPGPQPGDTVPLSLVMAKSNRAGITAERLTGDPPANGLDPDTAQSHGNRGARIVHTIIGGFFGTLAGAGLGAGIGAAYDSRANYTDAMFSGSVVLGFYGAVLGLGSGLIIGALWPVH